MGNSNNNKVCTFLSLCMLLVSCAGCALTPEQIRELEVQKQLEAVIEWELNQEDKGLHKDKVLVALFLDTEEIENSTKEAEYRCYNVGNGGYSGNRRIPFGTPWLIWERLRTNNFGKRIVIDPGPPYENVTKFVNLMPGEVTNLGRIVLEKVEVEGTASISGIIKDEDGRPLEGVEISSQRGVTTTNSEGYYRIDGFGLEVCDLKVTKKGYIPDSAKVSIRNMDKRMIKQDFVLCLPRQVKFRYTISPPDKDDFSEPGATSGTASFFVEKKYFPIPVDDIENENFRRFINRVLLNFRIDKRGLSLNNSYAPIFYERIRSYHTEFETINRVGPLDYNSQHCPAIQEGDIVLINGGKRSEYTVKILFEEIQRVLPEL
jgi:hypothetical protein